MKNRGYDKTITVQKDDVNVIAQKLIERPGVVQEYYLRISLRFILTIEILMALPLFALTLWVRGVCYGDLPVEGKIVLPLLGLFVCAFQVYMIHKVWSPILIIRNDGFLCYTRELLWKVNIVWDSVVKVMEDNAPIPIFNKEKRLKIIYQRKGGTNGRAILHKTSFQDGAEAFSLIKTMVSGKINNDEKRETQQAAKTVEVSSIKVDNAVALLLISGFIIGIGGYFVLTFYPPTIGSTWLYPLLMLPLSGVPLFLIYKMVLSAARGKSKTTSARWAAFGFNIGTICAAAFMFFMSPASMYWVLADFNGIRGKVDRAEFYYQKAEKDLSGNADFLFAFAQIYYQNGDWENAAGYFIDSYEKDPTNWMKEPLKKVVDSLYKAGKSDEALDWCDRIIQDYSGNKIIVKAFERKKEEITRVASQM